MWKSFRQLGRGHLAQLAFWKFCFRERYSFGKNVLAVWFSSVTKAGGRTRYYRRRASDSGRVSIVQHNQTDCWISSNTMADAAASDPRCSLSLSDLAFINQEICFEILVTESLSRALSVSVDTRTSPRNSADSKWKP